MFNTIIVTIFGIISLILCSIGLMFDLQPVLVVSLIFGIVTFIWLIASIIGTFNNYSDQLERFEELREKLNNFSIYKKMKDELLVEIKNYLGTIYPDHEKSIFDSITNTKSDINLVLSYPELHASDVLNELVRRIKEIYSELYKLQTSIEYKCARIRYYKAAKWEYFTPDIPENFKSIIYSEPISNI